MRQSNSPFSDANSSTTSPSQLNGTSDDSQIMTSVEDMSNGSNEHAHVNPMTDNEDIDHLDGFSGYDGKKS